MLCLEASHVLRTQIDFRLPNAIMARRMFFAIPVQLQTNLELFTLLRFRHVMFVRCTHLGTEEVAMYFWVMAAYGTLPQR
ncbi:hypothetical protein VN12_05580 [Pirellula sp. SH-Sr6A]|nr:hypothetical protein VN12_05580 [Pirellula sp. SH-Sr6A]